MIEDPRWVSADLEALAERAARAVLDRLALPPEGFEVSLLAADDARIAALNGTFRGKAVPTNVLSWPAVTYAAADPGAAPALPRPGTIGIPESLGDLALAYETCAREAIVSGKPFSHHVQHLIVHGMLHLLGYDHEIDQDATLMEALEVEILVQIGLPDPYAADRAELEGETADLDDG